jgi:phage recombination protein Bet
LPLEQREIQPASDPPAQASVAGDSALLELVIGQTKYSKGDRDLIRRTLCKDATDDEFDMFMKYAERTGLDPFAKQIYLVKRKGKVCIQTGIDGYRLIADRTKRYAGQDEIVYEGEGTLQNGRTYPLKATARVYKIVDGKREAFTATVRWQEYFPEDDKDAWMWKKMPFGQLGKCAEALAFRKGFPADLAGIYTAEDLDAPGGDRSTGLATLKQGKVLENLRVRLGMSAGEMVALIAEQGFRGSEEMTVEAANELIAQLEGLLSDKQARAGKQREREPGEDDT